MKVFTQMSNGKFHARQQFAVQTCRPARIFPAACVDIIARPLAGLKMRAFKTEGGRTIGG